MCIYISISADRQQTEKEIPKLIISDVLFEDNKSWFYWMLLWKYPKLLSY